MNTKVSEIAVEDIQNYLRITEITAKDKMYLNAILKASIDFIKNYITIVSSLDLSMCSKMINPLINQILGLGKTSLQVIQADDFMIDSKYTPYYQ